MSLGAPPSYKMMAPPPIASLFPFLSVTPPFLSFVTLTLSSTYTASSVRLGLSLNHLYIGLLLYLAICRIYLLASMFLTFRLNDAVSASVIAL